MSFFGKKSIPQYYYYLAIIALKILVTFYLFPWFVSHFKSDYQWGLFPDLYDSIAENIISGNGYRVYSDTSLTMIRSPGYIIILTILFYLFGKNIIAIQLFQIFTSIITAALIYWLAFRLYRSKTICVFSSLIFLFHPAIIMSETRGGVETFYVLFFTLCMVMAFVIIDNPKWRNFITFGIVFGFMMLIRGSAALIFPLIVLFSMIVKPASIKPVQLLSRYFAAGLIATCVMFPWIYRNYEISGHFVPTMTVLGMAMYQGVYVVKNQETGRDLYTLLNEATVEEKQIANDLGYQFHDGFFPQFYNPTDEVTYYKHLQKLAENDIYSSSKLIQEMIVHNSWAFWFLGRTKSATQLNVLLNLPLLILMIPGLVIALKSNRHSWLLILAIIFFMIPHLLILSVARYQVNVIPLLAIFVAHSLKFVFIRNSTINALPQTKGN
jgi:4-amino-4-deoxy-L-arabinose transferase-like glycosyltransferase